MQSGRGKLKKWVLEFETKDPSINPLMGWETSTDTLEEVILKFPSKEKAILPEIKHYIRLMHLGELKKLTNDLMTLDQAELIEQKLSAFLENLKS